MQFKEEEKWGTPNFKLQQMVSMESSFETLGRHVDHAHSNATSHKKPVQSKRTQNLNSLLRIASGD